MSKVAIKGATTGTGTFTLESPATNTDRTLTIPDVDGTIVTSDASGNVGVGTSSPATMLELSASNTTLSGSPPNNILRFNDTDTTVAANQPTGRIEFYVNDETAGGTGIGSYIEGRAAGNVGGGYLAFATSTSGATGATEGMRIDSSNTVFINGTTQSTSNGGLNLEVTSSGATTTPLSLQNQAGGNGSGVQISHRGKRNTGAQHDYTYIQSVADDVTAGNGSLRFWTSGSASLAERARIDSSGNLLVGTTSQGGSSTVSIVRPANTATYIYMLKNTQLEMTMGAKASTDTNFYIGTGSSTIGTNGVYMTNTGNSWNAISDERKKNIIEPIENGLEKVNSLRAVIGSYKHDPQSIRRPFLIAQDVQEVLPEAVNVQDEEDGTLGMSYTDTIPLLVAAIKELKAISDAQAQTIESLTARVVALEGQP
jgi:hypothetical protein